MSSFIDSIKEKYNMSNTDYLTLKDLLSGSKELGYNRGYSEGYNNGYKHCIQDISHEQEEIFTEVNKTIDKIENCLRGHFEGGQ